MPLVLFRIVIVLLPLMVWMVSLIPMDGVAVAADRSVGKAVFEQNCVLCHGNGLAGAPRIDHNDDWAHRLAAGRAVLLQSVLQGRAGMPPKGGNASLSDNDAVAGLNYLLSRVAQSP